MFNRDILKIIALYINDAPTWKSYSSVDTRTYNICCDLPYKKNNFMNHISELVRLLPNVNWNICVLSCNPYLLFEIVINHIDWDWNWYNLSSNYSLTDDILLQYSDKPWHWGLTGLSMNENITIASISRLLDKPWDWDALSYRLNIHDILSNPDLCWNWSFISDNKSITIDFARQYVDQLSWERLSDNTTFTLTDICNNLDLPWDWKGLSNSPSITMEFVDMNLHLDWDWDNMTHNPNLTIRYIIDHLDKQWDWVYISNSNFDFDIDDIETIEHLVDWRCVSGTRNVNINMITKHPNRSWDWYALAYNESISLQDIISNIHLPWSQMKNLIKTKKRNMCVDLHIDDVVRYNLFTLDTHDDEEHIRAATVSYYKLLSRNESLTCDFIMKNIDKPWDWETLSRNYFSKK